MKYLLDTFSWIRTRYQHGSTCIYKQNNFASEIFCLCNEFSYFSVLHIITFVQKKSENPAVVSPNKTSFFFLGEWKVAEKNIKNCICRRWQAISQRMFVYGVIQGHWAAFIHTCSEMGLIDVSYFKFQQCDLISENT